MWWRGRYEKGVGEVFLVYVRVRKLFLILFTMLVLPSGYDR
jgi:hypothetical protein